MDELNGLWMDSEWIVDGLGSRLWLYCGWIAGWFVDGLWMDGQNGLRMVCCWILNGLWMVCGLIVA